MRTPLVYLAGPITEHAGNDEEAWDWRFEARERLGDIGIAALLPLRGEEGSPIVGGGELVRSDGCSDPFKTINGTLARDLWDVARCDAIIFNLLDAQEVSIGTMIELGASAVRQIPRILISDPEQANPHHYGWVQELCPFWVNDLDAAMDACAHLFKHDTPGTAKPRVMSGKEFDAWLEVQKRSDKAAEDAFHSAGRGGLDRCGSS